ncbi:MAG: hypothetical protein VYD89_02740 [Candidatus Thermoplasmatota archaeon]|nr:hypothetical protein [Candidatus Thermoplasmatota archaeon]MED5303317.1 hypothetical protein [Candidatus Thermoplasmatota archaeon]
MGNEWWKSDSDGEQDADAPKSLRIPKTTNYTLEGGVNKLPNSGTNQVWGQASPEQKSSVPRIAWFLFGMIGLPFVLLSISEFTPQPNYDFNDYELVSNEKTEYTIVEGDNLTVYSFGVPSNFQSSYDGYDFWEIWADSPSWWMTINSDTGQFASFEADDGGYTWFEPSYVEFFGEEDDGTILWTLDESGLLIATNTDVEFLSAYYFSQNHQNELTSALTCFIWPVVMIGGIIWGFATKRRSFAYGIMSAFVLALAAFFLLIFALATAF